MAKNKKVFEGEFYTPNSLASYANEKIGEEFGVNWRDEYVVWDCAAGHGALTENGKYKELFQSTLNNSDLMDMVENDINLEATKFEFDFLNDDLDKIPKGLMDLLQDKREFLFFINPPYAKGKGRVDNTQGVGNTKVNLRMTNLTLGKACSQLYCQFLFRIMEIKNKFDIDVKLALFSPPLFLTSLSQLRFRELFYENFNYRGGFMSNSEEFGCREPWGITFTMWDSGENKSDTLDMNIVKTLDDGSVESVSEKTLYSVSRIESGNNWVKRHVKNMPKVDLPRLRNPITVVDDHKKIGKGCEDFLGFIYTHGNNVLYNEKDVLLLSSSYNNTTSGVQIVSDSFRDTCSFFMSRKVIDREWHNEKDEYLIPDTDHVKYKQWEDNSLVYSCFNNSSNQSSLRGVAYKEKSWDIINEFFWLSESKVKEMAEKVGYVEMVEDIEKNGGDRYMYNEILGATIDQELLDIMGMVNSLFEKSMEKRRWFSKNNPHLHLDSWDAGYYQLKMFWKKEFSDEFKEIKKAYRNYSVSLVDTVYELGFLKK